ncbi:MAG TPA: hypothetical protein VFI39_08995 [Gemmatimonadales bacterium]|nr:hypothetical protein [Gemmatimonadales bacterium]
MLRYSEGLAGMLMIASASTASAQRVPHPSPSRIWQAPDRVASDTTHQGGSSIPAAGAAFGGLLGLAAGFTACHSCDASGRPLRGLVGAATGAAIGLTLGSLFESF